MASSGTSPLPRAAAVSASVTVYPRADTAARPGSTVMGNPTSHRHRRQAAWHGPAPTRTRARMHGQQQSGVLIGHDHDFIAPGDAAQSGDQRDRFGPSMTPQAVMPVMRCRAVHGSRSGSGRTSDERSCCLWLVVGLGGLEPPTSSLSGIIRLIFELLRCDITGYDQGIC
jgi:hypothetical protein